MQIAVLATAEQWLELMEGCDDTAFVLATDVPVAADACLILDEKYISQKNETDKPIIINAVSTTLSELNTHKHVVRINGWNGFIRRPTWEIAGTITQEVATICKRLNKQLISVADEPGLVAARSIAMIINEAYFAFEQGVSSKEEIDIAMKLGTNYPMGPFEWAKKIGVNNIYTLLAALSKTDNRYFPAASLKKEATA